MVGVLFNQKNDFTGGINYRADQFQLAANESPDILNLEIDPRGGIFTRAGYKFLNQEPFVLPGDTEWNPKAIFNYTSGADAPFVMVGTGYYIEPIAPEVFEGSVYYGTGGNFTLLTDTGTGSDGIQIYSENGPSFAQWESYLYIAVGIGPGPRSTAKWVGDTSTDATRLIASGPTWQNYELPVGGYFPMANLIITHANKMFAANTYEDGTPYPNRLRWSHENSPENWYEDDYIDINIGGEGITGLAIVDGQLVIFKPKAMFLLMGYDADNFQLVELSTTLGIDYPWQCVSGDGGVYFFDYPKGLFFYDRNGIQDIFVKIRPILINNQVNKLALDKISVAYINQRCWLALPYDGTDNPPAYAAVNFIFDQTIGEFGSYTLFQSADGFGMWGGMDWRSSDDTAYSLAIRKDSNFVVLVDDYDNNEDDVWNVSTEEIDLTEFPSTYITSWFDDDRYVQEKTFVAPEFVMKEVEASTQIKVNVYYNFDSSTVARSQTIALDPTTTGGEYGVGLYGTAVYGKSTVGASIYVGNPMGKANAVQLEFIGPTDLITDTPGREWGINSISYKYKRRNIKG
jgi:hypothetical protein